jgi:hypothetical protein
LTAAIVERTRRPIDTILDIVRNTGPARQPAHCHWEGNWKKGRTLAISVAQGPARRAITNGCARCDARGRTEQTRALFDGFAELLCHDRHQGYADLPMAARAASPVVKKTPSGYFEQYAAPPTLVADLWTQPDRIRWVSINPTAVDLGQTSRWSCHLRNEFDKRR